MKSCLRTKCFQAHYLSNHFLCQIGTRAGTLTCMKAFQTLKTPKRWLIWTNSYILIFSMHIITLCQQLITTRLNFQMTLTLLSLMRSLVPGSLSTRYSSGNHCKNSIASTLRRSSSEMTGSTPWWKTWSNRHWTSTCSQVLKRSMTFSCGPMISSDPWNKNIQPTLCNDGLLWQSKTRTRPANASIASFGSNLSQI